MISIDGAFRIGWNGLQLRAHEISADHGFWDEEKKNQAEMIALMHSELSEALETIRNQNPVSMNIPSFLELEEELADLVIRVMDMGCGFKLNISGAILAKMEFNRKREYKHGKEF